MSGPSHMLIAMSAHTHAARRYALPLFVLIGVGAAATENPSVGESSISPLFEPGARRITEVCRSLLERSPMVTACPRRGSPDTRCFTIVEGKEELLVRWTPEAVASGRWKDSLPDVQVSLPVLRLAVKQREIPVPAVYRTGVSVLPLAVKQGQIPVPAVYRTGVVNVKDVRRAAGALDIDANVDLHGLGLAIVARGNVDLHRLGLAIVARGGVEHVGPNCHFKVTEPRAVELPAPRGARLEASTARTLCSCAAAGGNSPDSGDPPPAVATQWAMRAIDADAGWEKIPPNGEVVVTAVMDEGVDLEHEALKELLWENGHESGNAGVAGVDDPPENGYVDDFHGYAFVPQACRETDPNVAQQCQPDDIEGHGTRAAGIIGAKPPAGGVVGLVNGARIMPLRVWHWEEGEKRTDFAAVAAAITYAHLNGAKVLNVSMELPIDEDTESTIATAIAEASTKMLVVLAAGNLNTTLTTDSVMLPRQENTMLVMATRRYDRSQCDGVQSCDVLRHPDSNLGELVVDIAAPGSCICTTVRSDSHDAYGPWSQTSAATPLVSGAATLLMSMPQYQHCKPRQIRETLVNNALKVGGSASANLAGGILDLSFLRGLPSEQLQCLPEPP